MSFVELESLKDIPGYKLILKAILKAQIQQLIEQLAVHTDEESVVLTASVADGTLSHLGSKSGKGFLDDHEDIKSQFLSFCLKSHHRLLLEKGHHGEDHVLGSRRQSAVQKQCLLSPNPVSPQKQQLSTLADNRVSQRLRHEPYPIKRYSVKRALSTVKAVSPNKTKTFADHFGSESETDIADTSGYDTVEIKLERLDDPEELDQAFESLNKSVSEKEIEGNQSGLQNEATFQNEAEELNTDIDSSEHLSESEQSGRIIPNFSVLDFGIGKTPEKTCNRIKTQPVCDSSRSVEVEVISVAEMESEIVGGEMKEILAKSDQHHSRDVSSELETSTPVKEEEPSQHSHIGQILVMNMSNQGKLKNYQTGEQKRFANHSEDDVREKLSEFVKGNRNIKEKLPNCQSGNQKRFANHSRDDVKKKMSEHIVKRVGKSSERSIRQAADIFRQFLFEKDEDVNFEVMKKSQLAKLLSEFYINARTREGELYKTNSLSQIRFSLNRYLKLPPYSRKFDIVRDKEFDDANRAFKAAIQEIKASNKGFIHHYPVITDSDLILLYSSKFLSLDSPSGLQNRVQMTVRLTFCREITEQMERMTKDTFRFSVDRNGTEYMYKCSNLSGDILSESEEDSCMRLTENKNNPNICPVKAFKIYLSKLHPMCERLWQHPIDRCTDTEAVWYQNKPIGKNSLAKFMSNLSETIPLSKVYTNHSIRMTGNSILLGERRSLKEVMTLAALKKEK